MSAFDSPARQLFSVPLDFILYMIENPASPDGLEKLYQTCKYFWAKNPILCPSKLYFDKNGFNYNCGIIVHFKKITKFCPCSVLIIKNKIDFQKFYRFSPKELEIVNVEITIDEFDLLVAENSVQKFVLHIAGIINTPMDAILEKLPNAKVFCYKNPKEIYSQELFEKLNLIRRKFKLEQFILLISKISDNFTPSLIPAFMVQACQFGTTFLIHFEPDLLHLAPELETAMKNCKKDDRPFFDVTLFPSFIYGICQ